MKNKKFVVLPLLAAILLSGCSGNSSIIIGTTNLENVYSEEVNPYDFDIDTDTLLNMLQSKDSFCLYFYSSNCSSCLNTKEFFIRYGKEKKSTIYTYEPERSKYLNLVDYMPNVFTNPYVTPRVLFFKEGELSIEMNQGKFNSYNLFVHTMNAFYKGSTAYKFKTAKSFNKFIEDNEDFFLFSFDSSDSISTSFYVDNLYPEIKTTSKPILLVDENMIDNDVSQAIKTKYSLDDIKNISFVVEKSIKKETVNYLNSLDKFLEIKNFYF